MGIKERLQKIVGKQSVSDLKKDLLMYASDYSLVPPGMADFVVWPGNEEEISQIIRVCNEERIALVPVSSKVHFNGSTIPKEGGIILDLSRLKEILEIDTYNRKVRIQPGVTWKQLGPALEKNGLRIMMPLSPHPDRSVVTDYLEREVITNTVFDYGEATLSMGVVWPTGEIFRTGSASVVGYPNATPSQGMNPSGPGLDFYRLLQGAQGTMGVVTWMNLKVESVPRIDKVLLAPLGDVSYAMQFLHRLLPRRVGQECLLLNSVDLALLVADKLGEHFNTLRKALPPWTLVLVLSGLLRRPEEKIGYEEKFLKEVLRNEFASLELSDNLKGFPGLGQRLLSVLRTPWNTNGAYWKHRWKGGCQSLFFITKPGLAQGFIETISGIAARQGYPGENVGSYMQPIEHNRACYMEFNLFYDPSDASAENEVRTIYRQAAAELMTQGALFTRPYGELSKAVYERTTSYTTALKKVKRVFDPNNIMNPGNLCF
jgi:FAD/FMN-containing dehydrogenase